MSIWSILTPPPCAPLNAEEQHYAVIDGAQADRLTKRLSINQYILAHEPLFGAPLAPNASDATPHLLALADAAAFKNLMFLLADKLHSHGALTWMVSRLPPPELARRLKARLDARLPDRFDCVNRYFDGRVTPHLHHCLEPAQREVFFSTCTQWWVVDATHQWLSLPCHFAPQDAFEPPLELNEQQQAYLIDACYPYAVIEHFVQTDEELLDALPAAERYAFFRGVLQAAATFGIDGGATAILFCTLALTRGPGFYKLPEWQAALGRVQHGEITLQQAVKAHHD
jgi:Domain of unknown function (DUF4123)